MNKEKYKYSSQIFEYLENAILLGRFKEDEVITELSIAKEMNVSRTPVREALVQLEALGLIHSTNNGRGFMVRTITKDDVLDIYLIRKQLETIAVSRSSQNIDNEELSSLGQIIALQEFYASRGKFEELQKLDSDFHNIIYQSSKSKSLIFILSTLHTYSKYARNLSFLHSDRSNDSINEHKMILDALEQNNEENAKQAILIHIENAQRNILENE